jgi:hypothetical protein
MRMRLERHDFATWTEPRREDTRHVADVGPHIHRELTWISEAEKRLAHRQVEDASAQ